MQDLFVLVFGLFAIVPIHNESGELREITVLLVEEKGGQTVEKILGESTHENHKKKTMMRHEAVTIRSHAGPGHPLTGDLIVRGSGDSSSLSSNHAIRLAEVLGSGELATARSECTQEIFTEVCGASGRVRLSGGSARVLDFNGQPRNLLHGPFNTNKFGILETPVYEIGMKSLKTDLSTGYKRPRGTMLLFHAEVPDTGTTGSVPGGEAVCDHLRVAAGGMAQGRGCALQIVQNFPPRAPVPGKEPPGTVDYHFLRVYELLERADELQDRPVPFIQTVLDIFTPPGGRCDVPEFAATVRAGS